MRLKRLKIQALPGIEPGFTFEPPGAGINIITGPNAIGKSSLARAFGYLLRGQKTDPPALSLEADFESGASAWRVRRNGSQVAWYRDGNPASPPALPGADQAGLYRLSLEQLLAGDDRDSDLARILRNRLRGGFDLDALRDNVKLGLRYAQSEEKTLRDAQDALRRVEREHDALERQEQNELPRLSSDIMAVQAAQNRLLRLQQGLDLHEAIRARKSCADALQVYPSSMDKLRGDEHERLAKLEGKSEKLQQNLLDQRNRLHGAETALKETGLQQSEPDSESLGAMELCLQGLGQKAADRGSARKALTGADAGLKRALGYFNDTGRPPKLSAQSLGQAEAITAPLILARARRDILQLKLEQSDDSPDETQINKLYNAGGALREWLAATAVAAESHPASPDRRLRLVLWIALFAGGMAALLAGIQQALPAVAAALTAFAAAALGLFIQRRRRPEAGSQAEAAKQRFNRTGLDGPPDWSVSAVEAYLRLNIDKPYAALVLERERAAQAAGIRAELEMSETEIATLQARQLEVAADLGFDPGLPSVSPDIFIQNCRQLAEAESRYHQAKAGLEAVERDIARDVALLRDFLAPRCSADVPAMEDADEEQLINLLLVSFQDLKRRSDEAKNARKDITRCKESIQSLQQEIEGNRSDIDNLFKGCGLEHDARSELERRLGLLDEWKAKQNGLETAKIEEKRIRSLLEEYPEVIEEIEEGKVAKLQDDFDVASEQAGRYTELVQQQTEINTRLKDAGKDQKLSRARAAVDSARAALQDKREWAWLSEATELLVDDVEQEFHTENEPEVLSRARAWFREITANSFDLQLEKEGEFTARDLGQQASRAIDELSSGTRMQLLLALRLAWIEAQEQGGERLPLFLDEALTTSDEDRFTVMANSLERLAAADNRQIFYLSARRHECALWKQATGTEPQVIDLAMVRFPYAAHPPQDYNITLPPSLPVPEGRQPENYASALGVPRFNPHLEPGAAHLFYLLRDDLDLLYQLMDTWRITTLGQLEVLLDSDAGTAAVTDTEQRNRVRQRCTVVRAWTALWRRGRGRPVNRSALEQSGAISETFIDRVVDLTEDLGEDGEALILALRAGRVSGFRTSKIEELESWLAEAGYTDQEEILPTEERRRLAVQQSITTADADATDVNQMVNWLESASP